MGRGLDPLQKQILGVACTVNAFTQEGELRVKVAPPLAVGSRVATGTSAGPVDYVTPLGIYAIYGIAPAVATIRRDPQGPVRQALTDHQVLARTPEVGQAQTAASRAVGGLTRRGLLIYRPPGRPGGPRGGYLLTARGLEIGRSHIRPIPRLEQALKQYRSNGRKSQPPVTLGLLRTEATRRLRLACHEDNARSRPMRRAGFWIAWRDSNRLSAPRTSGKP